MIVVANSKNVWELAESARNFLVWEVQKHSRVVGSANNKVQATFSRVGSASLVSLVFLSMHKLGANFIPLVIFPLYSPFSF